MFWPQELMALGADSGAKVVLGPKKGKFSFYFQNNSSYPYYIRKCHQSVQEACSVGVLGRGAVNSLLVNSQCHKLHRSIGGRWSSTYMKGNSPCKNGSETERFNYGIHKGILSGCSQADAQWLIRDCKITKVTWGSRDTDNDPFHLQKSFSSQDIFRILKYLKMIYLRVILRRL